MDPVSVPNDDEIKEMCFKVLILGDAAVGKTSIFHRFSNGTFTEDYKATIGVDFASKTFKWAENIIVRINFWDMAGQERFYEACKSHFRNTDGIFCVLDLTASNTVQGCHNWRDRGMNLSTDFSGQHHIPPIICLGNKSDKFSPEEFKFYKTLKTNKEKEEFTPIPLESDIIETESLLEGDLDVKVDLQKEFSEWAKQCQYEDGYMVSAKTNKHIDVCLKRIIGRMVDSYLKNEERQKRDEESDSFKLTDETEEEKAKKGWSSYMGGFSNYC